MHTVASAATPVIMAFGDDSSPVVTFTFEAYGGDWSHGKTVR